MSSSVGFLALQLVGPMQAWGFDSQYNRRNTALMPTKSGIAGMCCAALGYTRGSSEESLFLTKFAGLKMLAIAIPRLSEYHSGQDIHRRDLEVRRLQDYHTVQNTRRASGTLNPDCVLTYRQYLNDASFGVLLSGERALLEEIAQGLVDPVWGIWLGRKACVPSAPVLAGTKENPGGVKETQELALALLVDGDRLEDYFYQADADSFLDGKDSISDVPVSFATENRQFSPRRIRTHQATRRATK